MALNPNIELYSLADNGQISGLTTRTSPAYIMEYKQSSVRDSILGTNDVIEPAKCDTESIPENFRRVLITSIDIAAVLEVHTPYPYKTD